MLQKSHAFAVAAVTIGCVRNALSNTSRIPHRASVAAFVAVSFWIWSIAAIAQPTPVLEVENLWFVELSGPPAIEGTPRGNVRAEQNAFRNAAAAAGIRFREVRSFETLFNGFSVEVAPEHRGALAALPGVRAIWPVDVIEAPERPEGGAVPNLGTALAMTGADVVQNTLGLTGAGIRVAVMDTGIDYDHPDLGGDGVPRQNSPHFPNDRVVAGWDFVGDDYEGPGGPPPAPNPFPDDCHGHGTHVAGIVGANGGLTGVAPDVVFGAYRVFGCAGSTSADIMLEAMERAHEDGMHVLNMSIGARTQWPQYPTGAAATRLQQHGMVVVASIGNSGPGSATTPDGPYGAGAPGVGHDVIGVASHDNTHSSVPYFLVDGERIHYTAMSFSDPVPTAGTEEIVDIGRACTATEGDVLLADPAGKVALASRGVCAFAEKASAAFAAGATAVVISNNAPGLFSGTLGAPLPGNTPVVGISLESGQFIRAQTAPIMMTWTDDLDFVPNPGGGLISGFSSFGMAPDLTIKPDISAPGGNINSTIPLEFGGYGLNSGTSMSSPHVAGAVALLRIVERDGVADRRQVGVAEPGGRGAVGRHRQRGRLVGQRAEQRQRPVRVVHDLDQPALLGPVRRARRRVDLPPVPARGAAGVASAGQHLVLVRVTGHVGDHVRVRAQQRAQVLAAVHGLRRARVEVAARVLVVAVLVGRAVAAVRVVAASARLRRLVRHGRDQAADRVVPEDDDQLARRAGPLELAQQPAPLRVVDVALRGLLHHAAVGDGVDRDEADAGLQVTRPVGRGEAGGLELRAVHEGEAVVVVLCPVREHRLELHPFHLRGERGRR
jgi:subtilisin family serine protease